MRREGLERTLDTLFGERLTDSGFLCALSRELESRTEQGSEQALLGRLHAEIENQQKKKQRVLDGYFEGVIDRGERDLRTAVIDRELAVAKDLLLRHTPAPGISAETLKELCGVFYEWEFLSVEHKRKLLASAVPDIRVADSKVYGMTMNLPLTRHDEMNHFRAAITTTARANATAPR
jgi:hypothetical protein